MNIRPLTVLSILAILLGTATPLLLSAYLAKQDAMSIEKDQAVSYAADALARSEAVTEQIDIAFKRLLADGSDQPCSEESQALMRKLALSSSYIHAIGHIVGNRLVCSSLGKDVDGVDLGLVDIVSPSSVKIRLNVEFPFARETRFVAVERDGFVAIIHKGLPIDTTIHVNGAVLAAFTYPEAQILTARGAVEPKWLDAIALESEAFVDDNHVVAVMKSGKYYIATVCALPIADLNQRIHQASVVTIPIGMLASLAMAWAFFHLFRRRAALPTIIKCALREKEFFLEYQPIVELSTGRWVGAEALIRWRRATGEIMKPDIFIPVAEESGLIQQVNQYVVDQIASEAGKLFQMVPDFHIAINLAAADLHDDATVMMFQKLAAATGAGRNNIIAEATERSFTNHGLASEVIAKLQAEGFPVAIDDFGTGYSSLAYLEKGKFDYLKIDKSFVDTINTEAATSEVVLHIIEMAKSLRIEMIAEGVETEIQSQFLRERGVQYGQGWLFAKPMPFTDLLHTLETSKAAQSH